MELPDPEALVTISPQIPWYFIVALVVAAIVIVLLIVKAVAYGLAAGHDRRARQEGKHHPGRRPSGGTLTAVVLAALGAVIVGVNYQAIWYFANPELSSPAENELSVREQLAEQGAESLTLRATDPLHSLQRIDEEAWNDDLPLEALLVCDMGQMPEAGQFPPYDRHSWALPVSYTLPDDDQPRSAVLERDIEGEACVFTLRDADDQGA